MGAAQASVAKGPASAGYAPPAALLADRAGGDGYMPPLASLAAIPVRPLVQRACGGCAAEEVEELPVQPRLEVGAVGDRFEQEADAIAGQVMAMRDAGTAHAATRASVQRACGPCSASVDEPRARRTSLIDEEISEAAPAIMRTSLVGEEFSATPPMIMRTSLIGGELGAARADDDLKPRPRRTEPGAPETIGASHTDLTRGGSPLPAATRDFFEERMGRDLGHVRIHQGGDAAALNRSIAARAFTYRSHVWLGSGEGAGPSFTMAHELAHVLQQTAPGPLGAGATPAPPAVQRTYYYEEQGKSLPATHDEVVTWLTNKDSKLFAEVPVPNANRLGRQRTKKRFGRADLAFISGTGVPIGMSTASCQAKSDPAWYCVPNSRGAGNRKPTTLDEATFGLQKQSIINSGAPWGRQETDSLPRFGRVPGALPMMGFVRDAGGAQKAASLTSATSSSSAPPNVTTTIDIGDVKAGAFESARMKAVRQIANYMLGFQETRQLYEDVRNDVEDKRARMRAARVNDFSALPPPLTPWTLKAGLIGSISGVSKVHRVETGKTIVLKKWTSDGEGGIARSEDVQGAAPVTGSLFLWRDTGLAEGAWSYLWSPDGSEASQLYNKLGPDPDFDTIHKNSDCLRSALLMPASPPKPGTPAAARTAASPAPACLKPLRIGQAPANLVRRAPAKAAAPKPKPPPDPFKTEFPQWEKKQVALTTGFDAYEKSGKGTDRRAALAELEARENIAKHVPGKEGVLTEKGATTLGEQGSQYYWMETLAGRSGKIIGQLRLRFGGLFEKLVNAYATVKEKVQAFFAKLSPKSPGKGLAKAVLTVVVKILGAIGRWVLPRVGQALMDCLEEGVSKKIEEMFQDGPLAIVREKIDEVKAFAEALTESVLSKIHSIGDVLVGDLMGTIEKIKEATDFIRKIVNIGKEVFDAVRLAICAAGGVESLGLSCAVSLIDKVLSWMGVSPLEALAGSLLSTCMGQTLLTKGMMAFEAIRNLPRTIAGRIIDVIKPHLPQAAQGILCDTEKMKFEFPDIADVTCGSGGSPGATPGPGADRSYTPGSWTPPARFPEALRNRIEKLAAAETGSSAPQPPEPPKPEEAKTKAAKNAGGDPGAPPQADPAQAPAKLPAGTPAAGKPATAAGTGGEGGQPQDEVSQGHLKDAQPSKMNLEIRGGFSPTAKYDGKTAYPAILIGTDNLGRHFGPVPVEIFVTSVVTADKGFKISYTFRLNKAGDNIIIRDVESGTSMEIYDSGTRKFVSKLRPPGSVRPAEPPKAAK